MYIKFFPSFPSRTCLRKYNKANLTISSSLGLSRFFCFFNLPKERNFFSKWSLHTLFSPLKQTSLILNDVWLCWGMRPKLKSMINPNSSWPNLNPFQLTKNHISSSFFIRQWHNNICTIRVENLSSSINKKNVHRILEHL